MSVAAVIAQSQPADTSSAAAAVFGVIVLVGLFSAYAVSSRGRRTLLPLVAVLLGGSIAATSITEAKNSTFSPLTFLGLFFAFLMIAGGLGALREGVAVPEVDGVEPEIHPAPPRITPDD